MLTPASSPRCCSTRRRRRRAVVASVLDDVLGVAPADDRPAGLVLRRHARRSALPARPADRTRRDPRRGAPPARRVSRTRRTLTSTPRGQLVLDRDAGLPQEPGRLRQAHRGAARRRPGSGRRPRRRRPRRRQHVRLRRGRPPRVRRHHPRPRRRPPRRRPPRRHRVPRRAVRRRARRRPSRGRRRRRVRQRGAGQPRPQAERARRSTCSTCPGRRRRRRGPTSRSPRAATAPAGSAPSRPSAGPQRSRTIDDIVAEVEGLVDGGRARDRPRRPGPRRLRARPGRRASAGSSRSSRPSPPCVAWVRLLYVYPGRPHRRARAGAVRGRGPVRRPVAPARVAAAAAPHAPLGRRRAVPRAHRARSGRRRPDAAFRSNFIVGYPGETEADHDELLAFVDGRPARLVRLLRLLRGGRHLLRRPRRHRWRPGSSASGLSELRELQDAITAAKRDELLGSRVRVLVDAPGTARSHREAPEIDGIIAVPDRPAGRRVRRPRRHRRRRARPRRPVPA